MFSNLGWGEILVLAVIGLVVFGPERLPQAISDGMKLIRQMRDLARGAASDLKSELGPEMADLDLSSLHPRRFLDAALNDDPAVTDAPAADADPSVAAAMATPVGRPAAAPLAAGERPPYDPDAT